MSVTNTVTVSGFAATDGTTNPFSTLTLNSSIPNTTYSVTVSGPDGAGVSVTGTDVSIVNQLQSYYGQTAQTGPYTLTLAASGTSTATTLFVDTAAGVTGTGTNSLTATTVACFLRGTMIATPSGEVAIESLRIGEIVSLANGGTAAIKWIATRSYDRPSSEAQPVCIRAGAISENVPSRDLFVSPLHAMLIDGVLVPALSLANDLSIVKCADFDTVEYLHIELDTHAAILANGAPSETYADCENRWMFHNAEEFAALYPNETPATWAFCAPRAEEGAMVEAIRARLAARAPTLDSVKTTDHRLFVLADGRAVMPEVVNGRYTFRLPAAPADLRIVSRRAVPASLGLSDDTRSVGVNLRTITLRSGSSAIAINAADGALTDGFHAAEGNHRWTNGDAVLPASILASLTGPVSLEIDAEGLAFYPAEVSAVAA